MKMLGEDGGRAMRNLTSCHVELELPASRTGRLGISIVYTILL